MDATAALAGLRELSNQVVEAVIVGHDGAVEAATEPSARAESLAAAGRELGAAAAEVRPTAEKPNRIEVSLERGSVFVVREGDRTIVALTGAEPTAGLVVYDLRAALGSIDSPPSRRRAKKPADA